MGSEPSYRYDRVFIIVHVCIYIYHFYCYDYFCIVIIVFIVVVIIIMYICSMCIVTKSSDSQVQSLPNFLWVESLYRWLEFQVVWDDSDNRFSQDFVGAQFEGDVGWTYEYIWK